jgi:nucleotide-binding universal stress UspA family protein
MSATEPIPHDRTGGVTADAGIVVGVDGSESGRRAAAWAADVAAARGRPLTLVHARPDEAAPVLSSTAGDEVDAVLRDEAARVQAEHPGVEVREIQHPESPVDALLDVGRDAELVVLGSRGLGGFAGLLLGSTPTHVVPYSSCPVVVVRPEAPEAGPHAGKVVLAFDGSPASMAAAAFAVEHAASTGRALVVLHATRGEPDEEVLARVAGVAAARPEVAVEQRTVTGRPAAAVVEQGAGAALLVLGSRGLGGFRGLLLGSVSQQVIAHASGAVAVVRAAEDMAASA